MGTRGAQPWTRSSLIVGTSVTGEVFWRELTKPDSLSDLECNCQEWGGMLGYDMLCKDGITCPW